MCLNTRPWSWETYNQSGSRLTGSDQVSSLLPFRGMAADRMAMEYWRKLGWSCGNWVSLFVNFTAQGYEGDVDHPTKERLDQAIQICSEQLM